jgi:hypothetical protein
MADVSDEKTDSFVAAFRAERFLSYSSTAIFIDEYIIAGAFILLAKRSTVPPCEYKLWILQAVMISWIVMEESYDLNDGMEVTFGRSKANEIYRQVCDLGPKLDWKMHLEKEEIDEVLISLKSGSARDILRERLIVPKPISFG